MSFLGLHLSLYNNVYTNAQNTIAAPPGD